MQGIGGAIPKDGLFCAFIRTRSIQGLAATVIGISVVALPPAAQGAFAKSPPPWLQGERLVAGANSPNNPGTITSTATCNATGTSTITFAVTGIATGPYPGTFSETGSTSIGPQPTTDFAQLLTFHADFAIHSVAGEVKGTKDLTIGTGSCGDFNNPFDRLIAAQAIYDAKIRTTSGASRDKGTTSTAVIDNHGFNKQQTFVEDFVATTDQLITARGRTFEVPEDRPFTGKVAIFRDPDTTSTAAEYTASIDWGDGSPTTTGVVSGPSGGPFAVNGSHTYAEGEKTFTVKVTVTDADNAANTSRATSTAEVVDR
jgi:hypothetical protein